MFETARKTPFFTLTAKKERRNLATPMIYLGIASCFLYPDISRLVFGRKTLCYLERDMARYLTREDVMPVLIPDLSRTEMRAFLDRMDGFVFQGGSDIAPQSYGATPIEDGRWPGDPYRDEYELEIMDYAIRQEKPVLAICRGFQLMNVYFGGSLLQDILLQRPGSIPHRDAEAYDQLHHGINLVPGTLLTDMYGETHGARVNSVHHQGVEELGKDLETMAFCAEDGLVEAFQWKGAPPGKVLGVQWHPEFFYNAPVPLLDAEILYDHFLGHLRPLA
jgi:putative glutamine amidotransferase